MEGLSHEEIVRRLKVRLAELKQSEENIQDKFSVVLKAFRLITMQFVAEPGIYSECLLKYFRHLLSVKNKLNLGNAHDVYECKFPLLTKTLGTIVGVPWLHGRYRIIYDLLFYWLTSTKSVPADLRLEVLSTQTDAFKNLVILAASSGDNETQRQTFELMLLCYADGMFELATRETIAECFKAVNFEVIEYILHSFDTPTNGKLKKHDIRKILSKFNEVVEKKVLSLIVNDIRIGQNVLLPDAKSGFWIDFNPGPESISFAFDGKSIVGSPERSCTVRALILQDMIQNVQTSLCGESKNIKLTFTLCKPLSVSDSQTYRLLANEREMEIELAYSEEKYPVLEKLLNDWYKVDILVAESDCSNNGDEDAFPFVLPFNVAHEQRAFGIPKLSYVADTFSETSNEHEQQTQNLPNTNKTKLCKSFSTANDHVSRRSDSSDCEMFVEESENGGEQDESDIVKIGDSASVQSADSNDVTEEFNVNGELRSDRGRESPKSASHSGSINEPQTNGNDCETSSVKGLQPKRKRVSVSPKQAISQNQTIELFDDDLEEPRQSPKRIKTLQTKRSITFKSTNGPSQQNLIEINLNERNGSEIDDHFHQTYVERTPSPEHVVHPTQLISRAKPIPSQRTNGERVSIDEIVHLTQDVPRASRGGPNDERQTNGNAANAKSRSQTADETQQNGVRTDDAGLSFSPHNKIGRSPTVTRSRNENYLQKGTVKEIYNNKRTVPVETSPVKGLQPKRKKVAVSSKQIDAQIHTIELSDDDLEEPRQSPKRVKTSQPKRSVRFNGVSQQNSIVCNGNGIDDHFHQTYVERTPSLEHVVHPTQFVSRAKPIPPQRTNGERASYRNPSSGEIVHLTQNVPRAEQSLPRRTNCSLLTSSPDCVVDSTQSSPQTERNSPRKMYAESASRIPSSNQISHRTQIVTFVESSSPPKDSHAFVRIKEVSSDEAQMNRKAKQAANSTSSKRSTPISVIADVHSKPSEIDAIVKERKEDDAKRSSNSILSRKQTPQPIDLDAIEVDDTYDECRKEEMNNPSLIIAQPKCTRKSPTKSISKSVQKIAPKSAKATSKQTPQPNATADRVHGSIYFAPTQTRHQTNDSERHEPVKAVVAGIINHLVEDEDPQEMSAPVEPPMEPLPVEPIKPRRKATASRPRVKAPPKTQRKTKNASAKQPKLTFEMPKRRQTRKKVITKNGGVSPCSDIASMTAIGRGFKRKLFNKGDEVIDVEEDDVPLVQSKRITTNYEDILDTTVSTTADLPLGCDQKSKKFLNRVARNMDKISSLAKNRPPSPPKDPFDALLMDTNDGNGTRSNGKVSYSYRTSAKTKPEVNTSTKKSTCETRVDVGKTINCKTAEDRNVVCSTRSDASDIGDYEVAAPNDQIKIKKCQRLEERLDKIVIEVASIRNELCALQKN